MYAQALYLIERDFNYWFEMEEIEVIEKHNENFRDECSEEQLLPILFDVPAEGRGNFLTTAQISEKLVSYGNIKKPIALNRLGMMLAQQGYQSVRPRIGGIKTRGWLVYQRDSNEIDRIKHMLKEP